MVQKALKALPSSISYDPVEHTTIDDLRFLVQHELDLLNEEPEHFEHIPQKELKQLKQQCVKFLKIFN